MRLYKKDAKTKNETDNEEADQKRMREKREEKPQRSEEQGLLDTQRARNEAHYYVYRRAVFAVVMKFIQ